MIQIPTAVFLFNLLQDVSVLRPVALLAETFEARLLFLISDKFAARDSQGVWATEIATLAEMVGADVHHYDSAFAAHRHLQSGHGAIFAGSESNLPAHMETHDVFRTAPHGFARVALQHGFECVGFLQNRQHDLAHGRNVSFAADIVAGWMPAERLRSMPSSQRDKLYVTGPSTVLTPRPSGEQLQSGLVCENLHSVRLSANGATRGGFMSAFGRFCASLASEGDEQVRLRPHPGGQFLIRNGVAPPPNVIIDSRPLYQVDLSAFGYGISPPSSILVDMLLAGLPAAVWIDADAAMDVSNYDGLVFVSGAEEWLAFRRDARVRREMILHRQKRFLDSLEMPTDRQEVRRRFHNLLSLALGTGSHVPPPPRDAVAPPC